MERRMVVAGLGYAGAAIAAEAAGQGFAVTGTARDPARAAPPPGVAVVPFADAAAAIRAATHLVVTAAPGEGGDPVLAAHAAAIAAAPGLRWIGYLSTTGVYGDRGGAEVDEATAPAPGQDRSRRRLAAEQAWLAAAGARGVALDLFRTGGIYGPGRSALDEVRDGTARRVVKPGHSFSRIHRDDIALAVVAAALRPDGIRVLHLVDDEPGRQRRCGGGSRAAARRSAAARNSLRDGAGTDVADGALLLVGEPARRQRRDEAGPRHRLALPDLPGGAAAHPRGRGLTRPHAVRKGPAGSPASRPAGGGPPAATAGGRHP
jgi:hypothetical protein